MFCTRWTRKLLAFPKSKGQRRPQAAQARRPIRLMLESLEVRLAPAADPTTVLAGNATVNYFGTNASPSITIPMAVNDNLGGTATSGTVTVSLIYNGSTPPPPVVLGTATVGPNGTALVNVPSGALPSNLQTGSYQLEETYAGNASFASSDAFGTLKVAADPTTVSVGDGTVNFANTLPFTIQVGVNSPNGTVNSGTVSVSLVSGNTVTPLGTATVSGGTATLSVTNPAALAVISTLAPGSYQLTETYNDVTNGQFDTSTAMGKLTVNSIPTVIHISDNVHIVTGSTSPFTIPLTITTPFGTASGGTVSLDLVSGSTTIPLGTATVGPDGTAAITVMGVPLSELAALPPGSYQLQVNYTSPTGSTLGSTSTITGFQISALPTTTLTPGNAVSTSQGGLTTIPVVVSSSTGLVNSGTVTISLVTPSGSSVLGSASVTNGTANVRVTIPSGLSPGNYSLVETYTDNTGTFLGSSGTGTLAVQPLNPIVAALELAVDAAGLVSMGNPGAINELQLFSDVFLHQPFPMSAPQLVHDIQTLFPQTGDLGLPALGAAMFLAQDLAIENPMT